MFGLFKRKNPILEQLVSELDVGLTNFSNNIKEIDDNIAKATLLTSYVKIAQELDDLKRKKGKNAVERLQELEQRLKQLNNMTEVYNNSNTQNKTVHTKPKKTILEGANFDYLLQKNPVRRIERKDSQPTLLSSERRMLQTKEEKGAESKVYRGKKPLKLEGADFNPLEYFEINFQNEKFQDKKPTVTSQELERMPTIITSTLESKVYEYESQSRQKFIEKENGRIKKIKVDKKVYENFLYSTKELLSSYLTLDKGKKDTMKRRNFETLELQVEKVLEEGMFKIHSRLNPIYTGFKTEEAKQKYSYNTEESFEKQYTRLLYSSLKNFKGKNDEERRFSKAKALTELLGQYTALNTGRVDRKELLEYSRRINSYIEKHVKKEKRDRIKIRVELEENTIQLYSKQKSSFVYKIPDNTSKIILGEYKLVGDKYIFVEEKSIRQKINDTIADMIMTPVYITGAAVKLAGKGIESLGRKIKTAGNNTLYGAKRVAEELSQPYKIELKKLPRK